MKVVTAVVKMNINIHLMRQMSSSMKVGRMSGSDDESGDSSDDNDGEDEHLHHLMRQMLRFMRVGRMSSSDGEDEHQCTPDETDVRWHEGREGKLQ